MATRGVKMVGGRPVLLVHGFLSVDAAMIPLQRVLRSRGLDARRVRLSPLCLVDVHRLAEQVGAAVQRLHAEFGGRIDLVGVSQGGLAAVTYTRLHGGHDYVRRVVAVGTPFRGTRAAYVGVPLFGALGRGVWQCLPGSDLQRALVRAGPAPGEDIISIARQGDPVVPADRCQLPGAHHIVLPPALSLISHQTLGLLPSVGRLVADCIER